MLDSTKAYRAAVTGDSRKILLKAVLKLVDPDIKYSGAFVYKEAPFSKKAQLYDGETESVANYITLEANRWLLGGGFSPIPDSNDVEGQVGAIGSDLSGADGVFEYPQNCTLLINNIESMQACSFFFPNADVDGVPEDFTVTMIGGTSVPEILYTEEITGNRDSFVVVDGFKVYDPKTLEIHVRKWSLPYHRMRVSEIIPGLYEKWGSDMLASFNVKQQGDVSCLSLPYGTCTLRIDNLDRRFEPRNKEGIFSSIEERQAIPVYIGTQLEDGSVEYKQVGVFYQYAGGWRTSDNGIAMQWELVDIVGLIANRAFITLGELPNTLGGWIAAIVGQLGHNFANLYHVDPDYAELPLTCSVDDVLGKKCGDVLRWACMATGTWPRAAADTGYLTVEPLWHQGNELTLENLERYPVMRANNDLAAIIFTLNDGVGTKLVVSGNATASSQTVSVSNPFIRTREEALTAARLILSAYGGNRLETIGRGDPTSEIGDVDTVWLDESNATTGRRIMQTFSIQDGVLRGCQSTLLQANGSFLYENRVVFTQSDTWTVPDGITSLRLIVVGPGEDGTDGEDGSWSDAGRDGADGQGGQVWAGTIEIASGHTFAISISDTVTEIGTYSSAHGLRYPYGYTDVQSGDSYARSGVSVPLAGSGDGGKGGVGGVQGNSHIETVYENTMAGNLPAGKKEVIDNYPGKGTKGSRGATGCVVIYYDKETSA